MENPKERALLDFFLIFVVENIVMLKKYSTFASRYPIPFLSHLMRFKNSFGV